MTQDFDSFAEAYQHVVNDVLHNGTICSPVTDKTSVGSNFGQALRSTREIISHKFVVKNPRKRGFSSKVRPASTAFNHANFIWTMTGGGQVEGISYYNPRGKLFAKDSAFYEAAFGARLFYPYQQLRYAERRLLQDRSSRRALAMIYIPEDTQVDKLDTPCATYLHFLIRDEKLICICNMRSQSALMVLPYDFFLFSMIQELLAVRLKIDVGEFVYTSNSFHLYDDEFDLAENFISEKCGVIESTQMTSASDETIVKLLEAEQKIRLTSEANDTALNGLDNYWLEFLSPIRKFSSSLGQLNLRSYDVHMKKQKEMNLWSYVPRSEQEVRADALTLYHMWKSGSLGGEKMPEDVHPDLPTDSEELLHYLTLGMCLNYQRNSYSLWEACTRAYEIPSDRWVFNPKSVASANVEDLRETLVKHKIALQPNKHVNNWQRVSTGIVDFGSGDIRNILRENSFDIEAIREFIQLNKKSFPYLAGNKICNYWLYVLWQYTSLPITNREALTIAPDTHVINASIQLGLIDPALAEGPKAQEICVERWESILKDTGFVPIDIHTPLWLWSRLKFPTIKS